MKTLTLLIHRCCNLGFIMKVYKKNQGNCENTQVDFTNFVDMPVLLAKSISKLLIEKLLNGSAFQEETPERIGRIEVTGDSGFLDVLVNMKGSGVAQPSPKETLSLTDLEVDLAFKNLSFNDDELMDGRKSKDTTHLNRLAKAKFDLFWTGETKLAVNEMVLCAVNYTLHVSIKSF
jgi:hypothetical protein